MIEVEAKARIIHPERIRVLAQKIGHYKGKERKIDDYYTLEMTSNFPKKSLRVRKKAGAHQVNFKQRISYDRGVHTKKETEFEIVNVESFLRLLHEFGFRKWLTKEKYTEIYEIKRNFNIELNHVKKLGWFVEVEYLCKPSEIKRAQGEVKNVLKKLNIVKKDIVKDGYTRMLWSLKK